MSQGKGKTNADALADIAARKGRTKEDGTPLMLVHTSHLEPADLNAKMDTTPMHIVEICCGTPIWERLPAAVARVPTVEEPYEDPGY